METDLRKYIFLFFLPGAAGNFFSRCLTLLTNSYGFVDSDSNIPHTLEEKIQMLDYGHAPLESIDGTRSSWVYYENQTPPMHVENFKTDYTIKTDYRELPNDANVVLFGHPLYDWYSNHRLTLNSFHTTQKYIFYIDPSDVFEWVLLNALYKSSYLSIEWFRDGERMRLDSNIHKVNLKNIISGEVDFFEEFEKVCGIIEHALTQEERTAISSLYKQWKQTTLSEDRFEEFKSRNGIYF